MDHTTDAFVEITARDLKEAFSVAADAVIDLTLDQDRIEERQEKTFCADGKDLRYLLFNWLEEVSFVLVTEGFAIKRIEFNIDKGDKYHISARAFGEPLDLKKHGFRLEVKAPTFHEMQIRQNGDVFMRFLLDL